MVLCKALLFGILIANELLPATAKYDLPRPRINTKNVGAIKHFDNPNLSKYPTSELRSLEEDEENYPYRRNQRIYVITLDSNSQLLKKLKMLPLENINEESHESELPSKKNLPMLALNSDDENYDDVRENRFKIKNSNSDQLGKLFDKNGMLYLTKPKEIVKGNLRNDTDTSGWDALNRGLEQKIKKSDPEPRSFKFSDLVL